VSNKRVQQTIPEPFETLSSLRSTAMATKELVETISGQRGHANDAAVTWADLVNLGLIKADQVPKNVGSYRP